MGVRLKNSWNWFEVYVYFFVCFVRKNVWQKNKVKFNKKLKTKKEKELINDREGSDGRDNQARRIKTKVKQNRRNEKRKTIQKEKETKRKSYFNKLFLYFKKGGDKGSSEKKKNQSKIYIFYIINRLKERTNLLRKHEWIITIGKLETTLSRRGRYPIRERWWDG